MSSCKDGQIPIVDVADLWNAEKPEESHKAVVSIAEASRDYGFFYIKNHGVDNKLQENLFKVWRHFVALPQHQKDIVLSEGENDFRGYFKFQSVTAAKGTEPDWREGYYCASEIPDGHPSKSMFPNLTQSNKWPKEPSDFKDTVEMYCNTMKQLSLKIMSSLAVGLGLGKNLLDPMFTPHPLDHFGMYHYLPHSKQVGPNELILAEHTDYSLITMTLQDEVGGLEVLHESGKWIKIPPISETFVVNLGDILEVWSNGAYLSARHRAKKSQSGTDRVALSFFLNPCVESVIQPLPLAKPLITLKDRKPNPDIKLPITYGDFLAGKFQGAFK